MPKFSAIAKKAKLSSVRLARIIIGDIMTSTKKNLLTKIL